MAAVFFTAVAAVVPARAAIVMSVTDEATEERRGDDFVAQVQPLATYLKEALGTEVTVVFSQNLTQELQRTRSGIYGILLGPAHVIGSALRYGYVPVASFSGEERMVFVVPADSPIKSLADAKEKRVGLPAQDSLATYLANGEFNALGWQPKTYFAETHNYRLHDIVLHAVDYGMVDIGVVRERVAKAWLAKSNGRVVYETKPVPSLGVAVKSTLDKALQDKVHDALLSPKPQLRPMLARFVAQNHLGELQPMTVENYKYVSTLGYFTPTVLPGAKIVSAEEAYDLMRSGSTLYDVRTDREYREKHCKGAILMPYTEHSHKEVAFDMDQDEFDLEKIVKDKSAPLIMSCNGGECWKSYKASAWALKRGYSNVSWFRGGFPECRAKGLATD